MVYGIKRYKRTNKVVSVLHPVKNNNIGGQERKRVVGTSKLMPIQH